MSKKNSGQLTRLPQILDKAAELFGTKGYRNTTVRDIMGSLGMPSGSLYYHFATKEDLLAAVYRIGVQNVIYSVESSLVGEQNPWLRLEKACAAHLRSILEENSYAQVISRILPEDVISDSERLTKLRDDYELIFVRLIDDLALPPDISQRSLRLFLLGGLNWSRVWYRSGKNSPDLIAYDFVEIIKNSLSDFK